MILSRVRLLPQIRYDLEDFLSEQAAVRADAKYHTKQFLSNKNYILKGFSITGLGLNQATIQMTDATLIFPQNTSDFSWFTSESGAPNIIIPDADLTDGVKNYIEISLATETNTPGPKAFWDSPANSGAGLEFTQIVDTITDLKVSVNVLTGGFSGDPDAIPLAIVEVNGSGTITGIRDKRNLFYRLGSPGDESFEYSWSTQIEPETTLTIGTVVGSFTVGETVTFGSGAIAVVTVGGAGPTIKVNLIDSDSFEVGDTITGASSGATAILNQYSESFSGADKNITNNREMFEALTSEIKKIKGTDFWYQDAFQSQNSISEHLNSVLVQNVADAKFKWDGSNFEITDDSVTPDNADVLGLLRIFGRSSNLQLTRQDTDGSSAVIPVAEEEIVFIKIPSSGNRVYTGVGVSATNYQVVDIADFQISDENYWIAYRRLNRLYIRGYGELESGEEIVISDPQKEDILEAIDNLNDRNNQDRATKIVEGGTWSVETNGGALELTLSEDANIQIAGLTKPRNTISAQTISFPNSFSAAYVTILRTEGVTSIRTVTVADNNDIVMTDDIVVFARRVDDGILIGNSFLLKTGEFLELDGALAEINRYFSQLKFSPHETDGNKVRLSGTGTVKLDGATLSQKLEDRLVSFDGAVIDFSTGTILKSDGITALGTNFTPTVLTANQYQWYAISLVSNGINANGTIAAKLTVVAGATPDIDLAVAVRAIFGTTGIPLGQIYVRKNPGNTALVAIDYPNIFQLFGGSAGGSFLPLTGGTLTGALALANQNATQYYDSDNSNYVSIQAPNNIPISYLMDLPTEQGTQYQYMEWNGATGLRNVTPRTSPMDIKNYGISASVASNNLTITVKGADGNNFSTTNPGIFNFKNVSLTSGFPEQAIITSNLTATIFSGSTLGIVSGQTGYIYVYAINNAGTVIIGFSALPHNEGKLYSISGEGVGGAQNPSLLYANTSLGARAIKLLGVLRFSLATSGVYNSGPLEISLPPFEYDEMRFTATGSWNTNTTYACTITPINNKEFVINWAVFLTGAPNSAIFTINLPSGVTLDTSSRISYWGANDVVVGTGETSTAGGRFKITILYSGSTSSFTVRVDNVAGTYTNLGADVTQAVPVTYASGDNIYITSIPLPLLIA